MVNDINHPNIVQIFDFVQEPDRVYCVMELLRGRVLTQLASEEALSVARVIGFIEQVCGALEAAHARGVVHRDIKPDNIFVTQTAEGVEQVKVLDFGIARRLQPSESARTQQGMVLGTPYYMAPEQAAGRSVDARADLYSLGAVMFELLSGQSLAMVGTPQRLVQTPKGERIPPALADLVASCLALEPERRPASAAAVMRALKISQKGKPRRVALASVGVVVVLATLWTTLHPERSPEGRGVRLPRMGRRPLPSTPLGMKRRVLRGRPRGPRRMSSRQLGNSRSPLPSTPLLRVRHILLGKPAARSIG